MGETGYVLIADVLGFSAIVRNLPPEKLDGRVAAWIQLFETAAEASEVKRRQMFSDTAIAVAEGTAAGLASLVGLARRLLEQGVPLSLPIRGAIAYGAFEWGRLTSGKAIVASHELEQKQQWIGVSCVPGIPHVRPLFEARELVTYPAPMSGGPIQLIPTVVWNVPPFDALAKHLSSEGLTHASEVLDWSFAHKLGHTIQFRVYLRMMRDLNLSFASFRGLHPMHVIDLTLCK